MAQGLSLSLHKPPSISYWSCLRLLSSSV